MFGPKKPVAKVFGAIATIIFAVLGSTVYAQNVTAKYSDHDPLGGMRTQFVKDVWLPEITGKTPGNLEIQDFWGGALMGSKEILKGIGDGITDIGFVYPGHYPKQLVAHSIFSVFPRGPQRFENMIWLYRKVYDEVPEFKAELAKVGVVPLMITAGLPGAFSGKKSLTSLSSIEGDRWRAGSKWALRYLENAGATPVSVPWGDVYVALQTGIIDGVFTNYDGLHLMKFDEVAPNLLISKELWFATPFLHLANARFFNNLSEDQQQAIVEASMTAESKFAAVYDAAFDKVRQEQIAAGYTVTELSPEDIRAWENSDKLEQIHSQWVREAEEAGLKNAAEILAKVKTIHAQAMAR